LIRIANAVHERTGYKNLVMAGGVALNCVANGRIARESPFERVWVHGASGDAGGSIGATQFVWHQLLGQPRSPVGNERNASLMLGPSYDDEAIVSAIIESGLPYEVFASLPVRAISEVAMFAAYFCVIVPVGWFRKTLGKPRLEQDLNPIAKTYWNTRQNRREMKSHFRQS